jgi:transcriptional regulator with XRE-family HTH domain
VKDWEAVSAAIAARMAELELTQADVAQRAGVALMTVRELQHNLRPRRRSPRTLAAMSEALGWSKGRIEEIATGTAAVDTSGGLDQVRAEIRELQARIETVERKVANGQPAENSD